VTRITKAGKVGEGRIKQPAGGFWGESPAGFF
jgi:hypothetical protein